MMGRMGTLGNGFVLKDAILRQLEELNISYELAIHEPVYTMEQAVHVCDHEPKAGVKTLLVRTYKTKSQYEFALVVWRGDRKVDWSHVAGILAVKKVGLASDDEVFQILGIQVGAVSPFGYVNKLPVLFDEALLENEYIFINPGRHDETMKLQSNDLFAVIEQWTSQECVVIRSTSTI